MLLWWRTYTAQTGVIDIPLGYGCEACGVQASAVVRTQGTSASVAFYGAGGSAQDASLGAERSAHANAQAALVEAPCPACGALPRWTVARHDALARTIARKKRIAAPVAAAAAIVLALALAYPAVRDLRYGAGLMVASVAGVVAVASGLYALLAWPPSRLRPPFAKVFFWWSLPYRGAEWVPPPPPASPLPPLPAISAFWPIVALVFTSIAGTVALCGLVAWGASFGDVYVVHAPGEVPKAIEIDGEAVAFKPLGWTNGAPPDVDVVKVGIRYGVDHTVKVVSADGTTSEPLKLATHAIESGWLVRAPGAWSDGQCFVEVETVYGVPDGKPHWSVLQKVPALALQRRYDDWLTDSPSSVEAKRGSTVTRWSLRAVRCEALEDDVAHEPPTKDSRTSTTL